MPNNVGSSLGGSSLALHSQQTSFDVRVEADVISLLKIVHQNPLDAEVKNHLRDLIFAFRQDQNNEAQKAVSEAFSQLGVLVVGPTNQGSAGTNNSATVERKSTFGMGRPQPAFKTISVQPAIRPTEKEVSAPAQPTPVVTPASAIPTSTSTPTFAQPTVREVVLSAPVETPVASSVEPLIVTQAPVIEPVVAQALVAAPFVNPSQRINEIKSIVNHTVGNPVNLIEAHNEIGREYMNALLDAMKKANGGQQGDVATSMARLEKAFVAVTSALTSDGIQKVTSASVTPSPAQVQSAPLASPEPVQLKKEVVIPVSPLPVSEREHPQARTIEVKSTVQQGAPVVAPQVQREAQRVVAPMASVASFAKSPVSSQSQPQSGIPNPMSRQQTQQRREVPPLATAQTAMPSVAQDKQQQDLKRENQMRTMAQSAEAEKKRIAELDPLLTPAVTAGLGQLLSEWGLFKSSGIFGTGPSGKDHPLYQKLAPLTMAAVIAGRFEGVTPQIKQSITDYMNGWRYEEEIIHEHQETFEHYLRRVIFHILNKNKKAVS